MTDNIKKIIYYGVALLIVAVIFLVVYSTFFKCSVPYAVTCHYPKSDEIKEDILRFVSCDSDKDCSIENMNSFCSPGFPNLLKCGSSRYYCDNGLCKGCDCIGPSYDVDKRPDGIYEDKKEENNLKTKCCEECKIAFSKSPVGFGAEMASCGKFSSGQPINEECKLFFEDNPMNVPACQSYLSPFFPTQNEPTNAYMQALISDKLEKLELVDGCLRVNNGYDDYLIVWHYGFSLSTDKDGIIQIIDDDGHPVAKVGDKVMFSGGGGEMLGGDSGNISAISTMLPNSRCLGPYWIFGEIEEIYPKTVGITYFDDWKLINNTDSFLIKTLKPLAGEQIQILRNTNVRKLSSSEIENVYHGLIEENNVKEIKELDFVNSVYLYQTK